MKNIYASIAFLAIISFSNVLKSQSELWGVTSIGGDGYGTLFKTSTGSSSISQQYNFAGNPGSNPQFTKLLLASNGKIYGMTFQGGANGLGVIFEYDITNNIYTKKVDMSAANGSNPRGPLMQASNGKLYGMTSAGGANGAGVIFEYDITNNIYTKKVDFTGTTGASQGSAPFGGLIQASGNGKLYGLARQGGSSNLGVIFEYDIVNNIYTKKVDFTGTTGTSLGSAPFGTLVEAPNGSLYGLATTGGTSTPAGGVLFQYDYTNNVYTKKVDLSSALGSGARGSLIVASNGLLYGMTFAGGTNNVGAIFSFSSTNGSYTKLYDLQVSTGSTPSGGLFQASNGKLYGMTSGGGANSSGVIFEFNITGNVYTKIVDLANNTSVGGGPLGSLIQASNGKLYGLTTNGGLGSSGVLFDYDITNVIYTKKVDLNYSSGGQPNGALVNGGNNKLYGTTLNGGNNNVGIIYEYNHFLNAFTKKIDLLAVNGSSVYGSLVLASNNKFYGLTNGGGANSAGVLFEYDPSLNSYTKKVDLSPTLGSFPFGSLIQASNGKLYGMTNQGGASNQGVIFEYDITGNTYTKRYEFSANGTRPSGSLLQASNGKLYGVTQLGGVNNQGVLFEFDPSLFTYTKKVDLSTPGGSQPAGTLVQAANGNLYGLAKLGGANGLGAIFEYDITNNIYTKKIDLSSGNGSQPLGSLIKSASGKLYGLTQLGGSNGLGTLFEYTPGNNTFTKLLDFNGTNGSTPGYTQLLEICKFPTPAGAITSFSSNVICEGNTSTRNYSIATIANATSYTWALPAGGAITSGSNTNIIDANLGGVPAGTYTFAVGGVNVCGTGTLSLGSLTVNPTPSVVVNSGSICSGNSFTLVPTGASTYTHNGGSNVVTPPLSTDYSVTGTSSLGCLSSNTAIASITVIATPVVTANITSSVVCFGNTITLFGSGATTYTWTGGIADSVPFTPTATASYTLTGSSAGCTNTNNAVKAVTVNPVPTVTANVTSAVICSGNTVTLFGSGANSYTWTGGVIDNVAFSPTATSSYTLSGTSAAGCSSTNTAVQSITVNPTPVLAANSGTICAGTSFTIVPSGAATYTYLNGGPVVTPTATTFFPILGTSSLGCQTSVPAIAIVTVIALPTISVNSGTVCLGNSFILVPSGAASYTYAGGSAVVTPTANSSYTVTGTSAAGCISQNPATSNVTVMALPVITAASGAICTGNVFTHSAGGASSYTYSNGSNTVSPAVTSTYAIIGTNNLGCISSNPAIVTVTVNPLPTVLISGNPSICFGQSGTITASGANTYIWGGGIPGSSLSITPTLSTTYSVQGTDVNGCTSTISTIFVALNPLPTITVNNGAICPGNSFTIYPSGASTYTYSGGSNVVTPSVTSSYSIMGTNSAGCTSTLVAVVTVSVVNILTVTINGPNAICIGQSVNLTANGASTYTWNTGPGTNTISLSPTVTTNYTVVGASGSCNNTASVQITVNPLPVILLNSSSQLICVGESVTLTTGGALSYTWSIAPLSGSLAVISPTTTTYYTVTGMDANGCYSSTNITQYVEECLGINSNSEPNDRLLIRPNPNNGEFTIDLTQAAELEIVNTLGEIVLRKDLMEGENVIDMHAPAKGLYFVRIRQGNSSKAIRIIKQ